MNTNKSEDRRTWDEEHQAGNLVLDQMIKYFDVEGRWVRGAYFKAASPTHPEVFDDVEHSQYGGMGVKEWWDSWLKDLTLNHVLEGSADDPYNYTSACLVGAAKHMAWLFLADETNTSSAKAAAVDNGYRNALQRISTAICEHREELPDWTDHEWGEEDFVIAFNDADDRESDEIMSVLQRARDIYAEEPTMTDEKLVVSNVRLAIQYSIGWPAAVRIGAASWSTKAYLADGTGVEATCHVMQHEIERLWSFKEDYDNADDLHEDGTSTDDALRTYLIKALMDHRAFEGKVVGRENTTHQDLVTA